MIMDRVGNERMDITPQFLCDFQQRFVRFSPLTLVQIPGEEGRVCLVDVCRFNNDPRVMLGYVKANLNYIPILQLVLMV